MAQIKRLQQMRSSMILSADRPSEHSSSVWYSVRSEQHAFALPPELLETFVGLRKYRKSQEEVLQHLDSLVRQERQLRRFAIGTDNLEVLVSLFEDNARATLVPGGSSLPVSADRVQPLPKELQIVIGCSALLRRAFLDAIGTATGESDRLTLSHLLRRTLLVMQELQLHRQMVASTPLMALLTRLGCALHTFQLQIGVGCQTDVGQLGYDLLIMNIQLCLPSELNSSRPFLQSALTDILYLSVLLSNTEIKLAVDLQRSMLGFWELQQTEADPTAAIPLNDGLTLAAAAEEVCSSVNSERFVKIVLEALFQQDDHQTRDVRRVLRTQAGFYLASGALRAPGVALSDLGHQLTRYLVDYILCLLEPQDRITHSLLRLRSSLTIAVMHCGQVVSWVDQLERNSVVRLLFSSLFFDFLTTPSLLAAVEVGSLEGVIVALERMKEQGRLSVLPRMTREVLAAISKLDQQVHHIYLIEVHTFSSRLFDTLMKSSAEVTAFLRTPDAQISNSSKADMGREWVAALALVPLLTLRHCWNSALDQVAPELLFFAFDTYAALAFCQAALSAELEHFENELFDFLCISSHHVQEELLGFVLSFLNGVRGSHPEEQQSIFQEYRLRYHLRIAESLFRSPRSVPAIKELSMEVFFRSLELPFPATVQAVHEFFMREFVTKSQSQTDEWIPHYVRLSLQSFPAVTSPDLLGKCIGTVLGGLGHSDDNQTLRLLCCEIIGGRLLQLWNDTRSENAIHVVDSERNLLAGLLFEVLKVVPLRSLPIAWGIVDKLFSSIKSQENGERLLSLLFSVVSSQVDGTRRAFLTKSYLFLHNRTVQNHQHNGLSD